MRAALLIIFALGSAALAQPPWAEVPPGAESALLASTESRAGESTAVSTLDVVGQSATVEAGARVAEARVVRGVLTVRGEVSGSVTGSDGLLVVESGGRVGGDVILAQGNVQIEPGGAVEGQVRVTGGVATVREGGRVGGQVTVEGGSEVIEEGAQVGPAAAEGEGDEGGWGGLIALSLLLWLFGVVGGGALCYAVANLAPARVEAVVEVLTERGATVRSWLLCLAGLLLACALVPCVGWLVLAPLLFVVVAAGGLGWAGWLRWLGRRTGNGGPRSARAELMRGWRAWSLWGLVGVIPPLLPVVLLLKWGALLYAASGALLSDWGRDPEAGGCWPVRRDEG